MILKPIIICIVTMVISILLKNIMPQYVPVLIICSGIAVLMYLVPFLKSIINIIENLTVFNRETEEIIKIIIKIVAISLLCEFASQLCSDSGNTYLSSKITFIGKVAILSIISPHILSFMNNIMQLIQ